LSGQLWIIWVNQVLVAGTTSEEQQFKAVFTVPYAPGILSAVGVSDNNETETKILQTSGNAAGIKLIPDRTKISADGQDGMDGHLLLSEVPGMQVILSLQ
jgi:beta-galactosidase